MKIQSLLIFIATWRDSLDSAMVKKIKAISEA